MPEPIKISSALIFPHDSIVSAPPDSEDCVFLRGPFETLENTKQFCDPYVKNVDYVIEEGRTYQTIVSCGGRIRYGVGPDGLMPPQIYEVARFGGWDEEEEAWQEVFTGGADILPDHITTRIADCLLNVLGSTTTDFQIGEHVVSREMMWRAYVILRAGPTLMPW